MRSSHLDLNLANPMADFESEFNFLWSSLSARITKYNLISSSTITNRLIFLRVKIRSAPSLFLPRVLQSLTFFPFVSSVFGASFARMPGEYVNVILSSSSLTICEILHVDCRLMSRFLRITSRSYMICSQHTDSSIKTSLILSDKVNHTSFGLFIAWVPSIMSLVSFESNYFIYLSTGLWILKGRNRNLFTCVS